MRKPSWILVITMAFAVVGVTGAALAGDGTNTTLPFEDTFEGYTNLTPLNTGTNGWYGDSSAIIVQTNTVRTGTNAAMIPVDCTLSNRFANIATTNIWIQMDLRPDLFDGIAPLVNTNNAVMFFINTNGNFVVHDGPTDDPTNSANWVIASNNVTIATNEPTWVRINIYENFVQTTWDLYADGVLVTNNIGFVNTNLARFSGFDIYNGTTTSFLDNVSVTGVMIMSPSVLAQDVFRGVDLSSVTQTFNVYNPWSDSNIWFVITTNQDWVAASPVNAEVPVGGMQTVTLTYASTATWPAGAISNALVKVVATNGSLGEWEVAVTMSIMALTSTPTIISDTVVVGATPASRNFAVSNAGAGSFDYTATIADTCNWLSFAGLATTNGTVGANCANTLTLTYSNTAWWMSGTTSNTTVTIASTNGGGATQTVNVALTLGMELHAPAQLTNVVMQGDWASNSFEVWTTNAGVVNYTNTANQSWLVLSPTNDSLTGPATNTVRVAYTNTAGLTVGVHYGVITIGAPGCADVPINVTLNVQAPPMLNVSPALITNTVMEGQSLAPQTLRVWNGSANYNIGYQVATNQGGASTNWLFVVATNSYSLAPLATNTLTISYAVSSLTSAGNDVPSNYFGSITVRATNASGSLAKGSPVTIPVTVKVNPKPRIALSLTNLSPTVVQGNDAVSQEFEVWNANGFYTLNYTITKNASWLIPTPTSGTSTGQHQRIEVQYSTANLPPGITNAVINVVDTGRNETQKITVVLSVTPFATLMTDAQSTNRLVRKGLTLTPTVWKIWNAGIPPQGAMDFTVSPSESWLSATPANGTLASGATQAVTLTYASTAGMEPGAYRGTVQINATDAGSGKRAYGSPVTFTVAIEIRDFKGFDFQGGDSGASDLVLYREASGMWEIRNLLSNYATTQYLGGAGYQAAPGDYNGDGVTWMGVYRPASGSWYAQQVGAGSAQVIEMKQWAGAEYVSVPGDYDGDGKTDPGVYLEKSGLWMALMSGNGYQQESGIFGGPGYTALLAGDYDGDCKTDPGVYHRASGLWVLVLSTSQSVISGIFGGTGFVPVPTDYDGDGITDPAVYATETGYWYILPSSTLTSQGYSLVTRQLGGTAMSVTLVPAPGNYDGVGGADLGLYDTTTWNWYIITFNLDPTLDGVPLAWGYPMGRLGCLPVLP